MLLLPGSSSLPQAYRAMAQNTILNSLMKCFIVFSFIRYSLMRVINMRTQGIFLVERNVFAF